MAYVILDDVIFKAADEFIVKYAVDGDDRSRDKPDASVVFIFFYYY